MNQSALLTLSGVDHTARPTWKLRETIEFYRDTLGLPLVHAISARGWGPRTHPDFLHFFFDSGNGSTIAFFYYLGEPRPQERPSMPPTPDDHVFDATHTAWLTDSVERLLAWKEMLEAKGVEVSSTTQHEVIESIYFRDPNGYFIEITVKLRELQALDASDAALTLAAAMEAEHAASGRAGQVRQIDTVWQEKGRLLIEQSGITSKGPGFFVPALAEFASVVDAARRHSVYRVSQPSPGYFLIESDEALEFNRKELGLKPAVWYGLFAGGLCGRIDTFDKDRVRIVGQ
ncbi:Glyoxalase/Bleomycin resistance protein/Dioxygenase superfamily protein (plasmid) [Caballeronia sp. SBC1]|uniref:VOC family protein n=1 Tax=unclassified Caballeronia TaxID=2646786 RepID=UPI0013E12479|nr:MULTISPECIES: VOC family protein [unclassified Caballeronia]QIE28264.1 Glyoxalase/Bleomycin resistance protein/Dioxygenase superfamily protein [Caballeronia sp. SBC2]QIN66321.1 Glyoxalase/Bleomycin resistance protein/Dioxygenase superfamily protein [Caballeronia sp. SBC1]